MAQLTRISPETYRAIAPAVKDGALHVDGEAIELNAESSRRVADAVSRFRRAIPGQNRLAKEAARDRWARPDRGSPPALDSARPGIQRHRAEVARWRKLGTAYRHAPAPALAAHAHRRGKRRRLKQQSSGAWLLRIEA